MSLLPILGLAVFGFAQSPPEIVGGQWFNCAKPVTLASRKGQVTVVEFWTSRCVNCRANLPAYNRIYRKYHPKGVQMIGIDTPELPIERDPAEVRHTIKQWEIAYPIVTDNDGKNWIAWHQAYWPTIYVIDKKGQVAFKWEGELAWQGADGERQLTEAIDQALKN